MTQHVLLTGFRPFDGREINGTETIARSLHGSVIGDHRVETRLINVVWSDAQRFCERTLLRTSATLVLALGEASRPWPTFETLGVPHSGRPDVLGQAADGFGVNAPSKSTRLVFDDEWFEDVPDQPKLSEDAGDYLCNWMLWHGVTHSRVPMGFLHLPVQGNQSDAEYIERFEPVVVRLIEGNLGEIDRLS